MQKRNYGGYIPRMPQGVSRCDSRPNEFTHVVRSVGRSDFFPSRVVQSAQFALHLLQIGLLSFLARAPLRGMQRRPRSRGSHHSWISHEIAVRILSQSDNQAWDACPPRSSLPDT